LSYFSFQAEAGIRNFHVAGVQTCALPICERINGHLAALPASFPPPAGDGAVPRDGLPLPAGMDGAKLALVRELLKSDARPPKKRSEERRVGKECIDWQATDHATNTRKENM